jgi:hypothetical protein
LNDSSPRLGADSRQVVNRTARPTDAMRMIDLPVRGSRLAKFCKERQEAKLV